MTAQPRLLPRQLLVGPLLLDLFHRDASVCGDWLGLHPREFALLWRLAETPRARVTRRALLRDVWRLRHEPETNTLEVHVFRLRRKLAAHGVDAMVVTDPAGGYRLDADVTPFAPSRGPVEALDSAALIGDHGRR